MFQLLQSYYLHNTGHRCDTGDEVRLSWCTCKTIHQPEQTWSHWYAFSIRYQTVQLLQNHQLMPLDLLLQLVPATNTLLSLLLLLLRGDRASPPP